MKNKLRSIVRQGIVAKFQSYTFSYSLVKIDKSYVLKKTHRFTGSTITFVAPSFERAFDIATAWCYEENLSM